MKKIIAQFGLVSIVLFMGCARVPVYNSSWQQAPSVIDGKTDDWNVNMMFDEKSGFIYGLSNDNENLFVHLKISDQAMQRKIMMTGLTFWFSQSGKKKDKVGVAFPVKSIPRRSQARGTRSQSGGEEKRPAIDIEKINRKFESGMEPMHLLGFFGEGSHETANNLNDLGLNGMIRFDRQQYMIYELALPLRKILDDPKAYLQDSTMVFAFGIETGSLEMPSMGSGGPPSGGGMGRGGMEGGMSSGGGRSTGGGRQMDPEMMQQMQGMSESTSLWVKKAALR